MLQNFVVAHFKRPIYFNGQYEKTWMMKIMIFVAYLLFEKSPTLIQLKVTYQVNLLTIRFTKTKLCCIVMSN